MQDRPPPNTAHGETEGRKVLEEIAADERLTKMLKVLCWVQRAEAKGEITSERAQEIRDAIEAERYRAYRWTLITDCFRWGLEEAEAEGVEPDLKDIGRRVAETEAATAQRVGVKPLFRPVRKRTADHSRIKALRSPRKVNSRHVLHAGCSSRQRRAKTSSSNASSTRESDDSGGDAGHHRPARSRARWGRS